MPTQTQGSSGQPFQYTGQQSDADSGLCFLRARMYDPTIGRFLQRDVLAGSRSNSLSLNRYTYADDQPINQADPSGLATSKVLGPPVLVIDNVQFPFKAIAIWTAQSMGAPILLHRDANKTMQDKRRESVCPDGRFSVLSCDEYPFASTQEGGSAALSSTGRSAYAFPIPPEEQRREGGKISRFYQNNNVPDGGAFFVQVRFSRPTPSPLSLPWWLPFFGPKPAAPDTQPGEAPA